jgi:hypothetical protein
MSEPSHTQIDSDLGETIRAFDELHNSPPRVVAIVGVALVEERLREAIGRRLIDSPKSQNDFFENVLADYFQKIHLAYVLHAITREIRGELETLGQIRNKFAHRTHIRDFENSAFDESFRKLTLWRRVADEMPALANDLKVHDQSSRADKFRHSIHFALWHLSHDSFDRAKMGEPRR